MCGLNRSSEIQVIDDKAFRSFVPCVFAERLYRTDHVGRAARAGVPLGPLRQNVLIAGELAGNAGIDLKGIDIEESLAIQLNAGENAVVERTLHDIGIAAVSLHFQHAVRKEHQPDGGAGLRIDGIVRKIVVKREAFPFANLPDSSRDVHLLAGDVVKKAVARETERIVIGGLCKIRHGSQKIDIADGMSSCLVLIADGREDLRIVDILRIVAPLDPAALLLLFGEPVGILTPPVNEVFCKPQVIRIAGDAVHAQKPDFHFFVSGDAVDFALLGADVGVDAGSDTLHYLQKAVLSCRLIIGNGRLHHMSGAVELVAFLEILPFVFRLLQDEVSVEISVRLLSLFNDGDDVVGPLLQLLIRMDDERVGNALKPLGDIAVLKDHAVEFPLFESCGNAEVGESMAFLNAGNLIIQDFLLIRDDGFRNQFLTSCPEGVVDGDLSKVHFVLHLSFPLSLMQEQDRPFVSLRKKLSPVFLPDAFPAAVCL